MSNQTQQRGYFAELATDNLKLDTRYQRAQSPTKVNEIANNWNPAYLVPLQVHQRDGEYYVTDGGHRLAAARMAGIDTLPCWVIPSSGAQQEARSFVGVNTKTISMPWTDKFNALVFAGDSKAVALAEVMKGHDTSWKSDDVPRHRLFRGLSVIYRYLTPEELDRVLEFLDEHWYDVQGHLAGYAIRATRDFHRLVEDQLSLDPLGSIMSDRFNTVSWEALMRRKKTIREREDKDAGRYRSLVAAFVEFHNYKRRTKRIDYDLAEE